MKKSKKVMVFGVFDLLHPGHLNFLMQAKELGNKLVVSVARDLNVFKVKGQRPMHDESQRLKNVSLLPVVDKAILGGLKDPWPHILKEWPDIIALGYDQKSYISKQITDNRKQISEFELELQNHGLKNAKVVRLKPYWPEVYKSNLLRKKHEV